jgi:prepilin-type processing-associated H-X9-DG protein
MSVMSEGDAEGRAYVADLRAQGVSDARIAEELRKAGWPERLIEAQLGAVPPAPAPPSGTGLATAALVLGLVGLLLFPLGLVGLVLGLVALAQNRPGKGMAAAAVALGGAEILFIPIMAAILFPVFARAREKAQQTSCLSNVKELMLADNMYASDFNDKLPAARDWPSAVFPYTKNREIFLCPSDGRGEKQKQGAYPLSYTMSQAMGGMVLGDIKHPDQVGVVFDGTQIFGGAEAAATDRHQEGLNVGFGDGHAKWLTGRDFQRAPLGP